jgi:hypothetical protein
MGVTVWAAENPTLSTMLGAVSRFDPAVTAAPADAGTATVSAAATPADSRTLLMRPPPSVVGADRIPTRAVDQEADALVARVA